MILYGVELLTNLNAIAIAALLVYALVQMPCDSPTDAAPASAQPRKIRPGVVQIPFDGPTDAALPSVRPHKTNAKGVRFGATFRS